MRRFGLVALLFVAVVACSPKSETSGTPAPATPEPTPTPVPVTAGGTVAMGKTVVTPTGSQLTVIDWHRGAKRSTPAREAYQSIDVRYCASPATTQNAADLVPLFSLEMTGGNSIAPDSISEAGELRTKGNVAPGKCVEGPIVFQVGAAQPHFVVYTSDQVTKWTV